MKREGMQRNSPKPSRKEKKNKREGFTAVAVSSQVYSIYIPLQKRPWFDFHALMSAIGYFLKVSASITALSWKIWPPIAGFLGLIIGDIGTWLTNRKRRDDIDFIINKRISNLDNFAKSKKEVIEDTSPLPHTMKDTFGLKSPQSASLILSILTYGAQAASLGVSIHSLQQQEASSHQGNNTWAYEKNEYLLPYTATLCAAVSLFLNSVHQHFIDRNLEAIQNQANQRLIKREQHYGKQLDDEKKKPSSSSCTLV